jgi:hypothetical protein
MKVLLKSQGKGINSDPIDLAQKYIQLYYNIRTHIKKEFGDTLF